MSDPHNRLLYAVFFGALAGIGCGWIFGPAMQSVGWLGELFLDALKMLIIPLIGASIISGINSIGAGHRLGRLGGATVLYFLATTGAAVLLGLVLANLIQPGAGANARHISVPDEIATQSAASVPEILRSLISPNLFAAAAEGQLLPIIVFSILLGIALVMVGDRASTLRAAINGLNEALMQLVMWIMYFAPVGVFALIAAKLGSTGGGAAFWMELSAVGLYVFTVMTGLVAWFVVLFAFLLLLTRHGRLYLINSAQALIMAFGSASSSATLPLALKCGLDSGVDERAVKFVLPLGVSVNKNGTALCIAVAVLYIAQIYSGNLDLAQQGIVLITVTLAAIATAGIPQASLVTIVIVLTAVNLPAEGIGLLLAVDWFLDRARTTVNVWGNLVGAAVIEKQVTDRMQNIGVNP